MKAVSDARKTKRESIPRDMKRSKGASSTGKLPKLGSQEESPETVKRGNSHKNSRKQVDWKKFKNPLAPNKSH